MLSSAMLDSKTMLHVTGTAPSYNLSTHDLPDMAMPLRRFLFAGESVRAHSAALCSQGEMYVLHLDLCFCCVVR
jgi:hypothetical protein